ncbi:hypothetical protein L6164_007466 [Bauhinia variegata]|uniref:Uncharacterized protein n=1 Tax=Bauhinia variegata TaxID=167791 RepID=A0ACB9PDN1_BAUVA|nr:hypothetical protein L6164_007466 [Bauhinia variegata]
MPISMALKKSAPSFCSIPTLFLVFTFLCILCLFFSSSSISSALSYHKTLRSTTDFIKVYVADLPRSLNYGLLDKYWSFESDSRLGSDADREIRSSHLAKGSKFPPYPENPLIKQYSAEYWIMGDLMTPQQQRTGSFARRVFDLNEADVVFVPFFATFSAEMQLGMAKGQFRKKKGNEDYQRQRKVMDFVKNTDAWKRSGGRDHVFVLTGYD